MKRKAYSAGAVKFSFWFMEFRKVVQLLAAGNDYKEIKRLSEEENIFGASTPARAAVICSTTIARAKALDPSFIPLFMGSDVGTQKLFALAAVLAHLIGRKAVLARFTKMLAPARGARANVRVCTILLYTCFIAASGAAAADVT